MKTVVLDDHAAYVRDCMPDEVGTLVISGPNVFAGYRIDAQNVNLWVDYGDERQWLNTGDLGRRDSAGYFWLTGRKKELIIRGGHNIDPAQIEQPFYGHPAVRYAAAVGRPDVRAGELPVVYVQLQPGAAADEKELLEFANQHIGERAARPKAVRIIAEMPLTAVGKIHKLPLAQREIEQALTDSLREAGVEANSVRMNPTSRHSGVEVLVESAADRAAAESTLAVFALPFTVAQAR
jgi:fatty-acyl-CoA synthase